MTAEADVVAAALPESPELLVVVAPLEVGEGEAAVFVLETALRDAAERAAVAVVAPCDPAPAITPQLTAKLTRLAAVTRRRTRVIRRARPSRNRSARAVEAALVLGMGATYAP